MKKVIEIFQIDAFTDKPFCGNPAGVTITEELTDDEKQLVAREMNLSETAFITNSKIADFKLQWFTPTKEVDLCGHATIASLHFLHQKNILFEEKNISFETRSGIINCYMSAEKYFMQIPLPKLSEFDECKEEVLSALNLTKTDVSDLPFILLNTGYLFITVNSLNALYNIKPDFNLLSELSEKKQEFFDVAVFTQETLEVNSSAHLRFFAPYHGINEDPVTGSACGPLLPVMIKLGIIKNYQSNKIVTYEQGDSLNRKGRVDVKYDLEQQELYISGNAVTILEGKISV